MPKEYTGLTSGVDDYCWVYCDCKEYPNEEHLYVPSVIPTECPNCKKKYKVEFKVLVYEKDEQP